MGWGAITVMSRRTPGGGETGLWVCRGIGVSCEPLGETLGCVRRDTMGYGGGNREGKDGE